MKKVFKVLLMIIAIPVAGAIVFATYVSLALPNVGKAPDLNIERTHERVERGKYLVNSVAACMVCHSKRDFSLFAGPIDSSTFGAGGEKFDREGGFPGELYTTNITPFALSEWTDGELYRVITSGVTKKGKALFPLMPYERYGKMDQEDVYAMIAYLRTLKPVESHNPERELDFPLNFIVNTIPAKASHQSRPFSADTISWGKYLVDAASCIKCHSKDDKGEIVPGTEFGGGHEFIMPSGSVYSANITPDPTTGIGKWTKELFIQRFKMYTDTSYHLAKLKPTDLNTPMPWKAFATMTDNDLGAIYSYLRTVKPIYNKVEKK
jgi:Cytochrome c